MGLFDKLKQKLNGEKETLKEKQEALKQQKEVPESKYETTCILEEHKKEDIEVLTIKQKEKELPAIERNKQGKVRENAKNSEELEELTMVRIESIVKKLSFSTAKIQTLRFHLKNVRTDVYSVRAEQLFTTEDFLDTLKSTLEKSSVNYAQDLNVDIVFKSPNFNDFTPITQQVSVEVLLPSQVFEQKTARITALSGKTYEDSYLLTPERQKPYLIGRGKAPQLGTGRVIRNNIAFIEPNESRTEEVQKNKYVSRSILLITYNKETNKYEVGRTNFMFDSQHIVKINRLDNNGEQKEIRLNTAKVRVPLEDEDMIVVNGQVSILFELIND